MPKQKKDRVVRTYDVSQVTHRWLEAQAEKDGRAVVRQVEHIIEQARLADLAAPKQ